MDRYVIEVIEQIADINNLQHLELYELINKKNLKDYKSYYIGIGDKNTKGPKFLNWYDNFDYIKIWKTEEEANLFLKDLLKKAKENNNTRKDPFFNIRKTKGDWKRFGFKVIKLNNHD